jgi:Ca2+-binding EF-hand superfamily protein
MIGKRALKKWKNTQKAIQSQIGEDIGTTEKLMERVRSTFRGLDTSGDGFIDSGELVQVHTRCRFDIRC